ncbi:MAG: MFS transporter, partial [Clostridia bacterium]|nr:MFS transporter [Clostridia bacterium]
MGFKLTKLEKHWILYDVGNSAFTLLIATIMPIYFNSLATAAKISEVDYLAYWGYAASISTLFVALLGPILGTVADKKNHKKPLFVACILLGAVGCLVLGLAKQWLIFLIIYVIAKIGYSLSIVLYDSMLGDVTEEDRMDNVSSQGYAWGYIGSCIPFVLCLGIVLGADLIGITMSTAMMIAFTIVAVWWIGVSIPLIKNYKQKHFITDVLEARRNTFL